MKEVIHWVKPEEYLPPSSDRILIKTLYSDVQEGRFTGGVFYGKDDEAVKDDVRNSVTHWAHYPKGVHSK